MAVANSFIQINQSAVQQLLVQKKMVNIPLVLTLVGQVAMGTLCGIGECYWQRILRLLL